MAGYVYVFTTVCLDCLLALWLCGWFCLLVICMCLCWLAGAYVGWLVLMLAGYVFYVFRSLSLCGVLKRLFTSVDYLC